MSKFVIRTSCLLCGGSDLRKIRSENNNLQNDSYLDSFLSEASKLVQCQDCRFSFVESIPNEPEFFAKLYADDKRDVSIDFYFSGKRIIFDEVITSLKRWAPARSSLLDIGAGTGAFVDQSSAVFESSGIELSSASVTFAKSKNLKVSSTDLFELDPNIKTFNVITLIDVLEHLNEPGQSLLKIKSLLTENGLIYIKVPNYPAQACKQDLLNKLGLSKAGIMQDYVHINHFTLHSLSRFLKSNGFAIIESGFSAPEVWDLKWKSAPKSLLYRLLYNSAVILITKVLNSASRILKKDVGLNFYILARKDQ